MYNRWKSKPGTLGFKSENRHWTDHSLEMSATNESLNKSLQKCMSRFFRTRDEDDEPRVDSYIGTGLGDYSEDAREEYKMLSEEMDSWSRTLVVDISVHDSRKYLNTTWNRRLQLLSTLPWCCNCVLLANGQGGTIVAFAETGSRWLIAHPNHRSSGIKVLRGSKLSDKSSWIVWINQIKSSQDVLQM